MSAAGGIKPATNFRRGLPPGVLRACARRGVAPTRFVLVVNIARQTAALFEKGRGENPGNVMPALGPKAGAHFKSLSSTHLWRRGPGRGGLQPVQGQGFVPSNGGGAGPRPATGRNCGYALKKKFRCSTSKFGIGEMAGSNRTPRGLHRIAEKIGGGWPAGTAFKGRQAIGFTWRGQAYATITSRILWLEGLEPGFNRDGPLDSHSRYIYIHGTGNEPALGRPDSHGCVHLAAADLIPLYDKLPSGSLVWLSEN